MEVLMKTLLSIRKVLINGLMIASTSLAVSYTATAHAEGFFSKLFGSSSDSASFESMLSHVPADTAYMMANKKPIPKEVMDFHMKRAKDTFAMISKMQYQAKKQTKDSDEGENKGQAFFKALTEEFANKIADGKYEDTGFSPKATSLIYGYKDMPVMRISISDKEKIMEMLKRAEEDSGYKLDLTKCGKFDCFKASGKKDAPQMAAVLLENQLAMSLFSKEKSVELLDHLIGKSDPKESYSEKKWDTFLESNNYTGYGDGYINLKKLYNDNKELISEGFFAVNERSKSKVSDEEIQACTGVIDDHIKNMPEIIFGTKSLDVKKMDYEFVFKTSSGVSEVLQGIANTTNIAKRSEDPIFDLGVNVNFQKFGAALTTYSAFLVDSAEANKCTLINAKDVRKSMGGMMLVMNMGLSQFKSIYLSLNELEMDERMQPKKIDAILSIGSDSVDGLLGMATMMSPVLANLKIPKDGTPVKLPAGAIPSKGMPLPPLSISRSDTAINIMIGNDKPALKDYKSDKAEIMSFAMDGKRYYKILTNVMKTLPKAKDAQDEGVIDMMESMGSLMGKIQEEIHADKRGLVIDYHLQY